MSCTNEVKHLIEQIAQLGGEGTLEVRLVGSDVLEVFEDGQDQVIARLSGEPLANFGRINFIAGMFERSTRPLVDEGVPYRADCWELLPRRSRKPRSAPAFLSRKDRQDVIIELEGLAHSRLIMAKFKGDQGDKAGFQQGLVEIAPLYALIYRLRVDPRFDLPDATPEELQFVLAALEEDQKFYAYYLGENKDRLDKKLMRSFTRNRNRKRELLERCHALAQSQAQEV